MLSWGWVVKSFECFWYGGEDGLVWGGELEEFLFLGVVFVDILFGFFCVNKVFLYGVFVESFKGSMMVWG